MVNFGGKPPNPQGRLRRGWVQQTFCEAEQTLFASFSGKRRLLNDELFIGGKPPNPQGRLRRGWVQQTFCEAEQTLFASFSGKRILLNDALQKKITK
jgi:flavodoxin